jgi:hypothetical protein
MLRKIGNTLRNGDARTKGYLITVMVLLLAMTGLIVWLVMVPSVLGGLAAAALGIITFAVMKDVKLSVVEGDEGAGAGGKRKKKLSPEEEAREREEEDEREFGGNALANMTEEKLKRLFVRYKVKQEHVPVIIDLCIPERVHQAPGFAWVDGGKLKILLIENKPRMLERSVSALQVMEVERGIAVRAGNEYVELRESEVMKKAFTNYLPRYQKKEIGGRTVLLKNLYILDEDIKFTSPSVNELKKLFSFRVEIPDPRLQEGNIGPHYKALYTGSFLWRDGILSLEQYKQEIERVLDELASPEVPYGEFELTVSSIINSGLLPREYRQLAYEKREAKKNGTDNKKEKKKKRK